MELRLIWPRRTDSLEFYQTVDFERNIRLIDHFQNRFSIFSLIFYVKLASRSPEFVVLSVYEQFELDIKTESNGYAIRSLQYDCVKFCWCLICDHKSRFDGVYKDQRNVCCAVAAVIIRLFVLSRKWIENWFMGYVSSNRGASYSLHRSSDSWCCSLNCL